MSNSFSPIVDAIPSTPAQTAPQPIPLDAELLGLVSGGGEGPNDSW